MWRRCFCDAGSGIACVNADGNAAAFLRGGEGVERGGAGLRLVRLGDGLSEVDDVNVRNGCVNPVEAVRAGGRGEYQLLGLMLRAAPAGR